MKKVINSLGDIGEWPSYVMLVEYLDDDDDGDGDGDNDNDNDNDNDDDDDDDSINSIIMSVKNMK